MDEIHAPTCQADGIGVQAGGLTVDDLFYWMQRSGLTLEIAEDGVNVVLRGPNAKRRQGYRDFIREHKTEVMTRLWQELAAAADAEQQQGSSKS